MVPNTPKKPFHVAVCGGGIGGLCLTIGLLHQKVSVTLYESAKAFAEIGAGISFGPNSIRAMGLVDPAIEEAYKAKATYNDNPVDRDVWFDFRLGMKEDAWQGMKAPGVEGEEIIRIKDGDLGQCSIHRAHFLDELVKLVPEGVAKFGERVVEVNEKGDKLELVFENGDRAEADAVIGCDGVKSRIRHILLGNDHPASDPTFTGKYAYRGLIPMEKAVEALGDELARNSQYYLGQHGHVLTFPIEKGTLMNVVAFKTKPNGIWEEKKWVLPMEKEDMYNDFEGWGKDVHQILTLMEHPDVWALFDHPPAPTFYKGKLALLGDAAHASTPHQGAGAGQAIEDAFILSNLIGHIDDASQIEKAFQAYDAVRRPRSQKVVTTSRKVGEIYEFEDEEIGSDLEKLKATLDGYYDWIWNEDLDAQLEKARAVFQLN